MTWPGLSHGSRSIKVEPRLYHCGVKWPPIDKHGVNHMQKNDTAWETAARMAVLAEEADDDYEREHFTRLRDAWITVANRWETFDFPDVTAQ
jgi:hypothetical protein